MHDTFISNLVEHQFPAIYREEGELFVDFVKKYYEWMENEGGVIERTRSFLSDRDIDSSIEEFLRFFKQKYLRDIQLDVSTDIPQLVKHTLDVYRSKGTERCIDLFFRLVYGVPASVYYPSRDVMRLSDGDWYIPKYLEVSSMDVNKLMVGRQIYGLNSNATAFVERLVRRSIGASYREIFIISAVTGTFEAGEQIRLSVPNSTFTDWPFLLGSLTELEIIDGGDQFAIGDIISMTGDKTTAAKARVSSIKKKTGLVDFNLLDGGFGYTVNSSIYTSNTVLKITGAKLISNGGVPLVQESATDVRILAQSLVDAGYANAAYTPDPLDVVTAYYANGSLKGAGRILSTDATSDNTGTVEAIILSGDLDANTWYNVTKAGSTLKVTANSYARANVSALMMAISDNVTLNFSNASSQFIEKSTVYQLDFRGGVMSAGKILNLSQVTQTGSMRVQVLKGVFATDSPLLSADSNTIATIDNIDFDAGIIYNSNNTFSDLPGSFIYEIMTGSNGNISAITSGVGAEYQFSNSLAFSEIVELNTDQVALYANVVLNAASYGFTFGSANLSSNISDTLNYSNFTIGSITKLTAVNPGQDYNYPPFSVIIEPRISVHGRRDFVIDISDATGSFSNGEIVEQEATGSIGIIKEVGTNSLKIRRLKFNDTWVSGSSNADYLISGNFSGTKAVIDQVLPDYNSYPAGLNAVVSSNVVTSNTSIETLQVIDSGYGYRDGEEVDFISADGLKAGRAIAKVTSTGKGSGYSRNENSFLSGSKKLHDGSYYQDFSYEIRSPVSIEKYSEMLKKVLHVSGMKYFSAIVRKSLIDTQVSISTSVRE